MNIYLHIILIIIFFVIIYFILKNIIILRIGILFLFILKRGILAPNKLWWTLQDLFLSDTNG